MDAIIRLCGNSWIPATVCVGAVFHSDIQAKQSLSRSSSFHRFAISFPCYFSSSISSFLLLCTAFLAHSSIFCFPNTSFSLVWPIGSGCSGCPASFLAPQHIFARLSQEIAVLYGLLSLQTLVLVPLFDLGLHTNAPQP